MSATVTVKLKPYLQEFLVGRYGYPLVASRNNLVGKFIKPLLSYRKPDEPPFIPDGEDYLEISLCVRVPFDTRFGSVWITPENQVIFEELIDDYFREVFMNYMTDKLRYASFTKAGKPVRKDRIKDVILQFCSDYNIQFSHMQYETLKKRHYRNRKSFENKLPAEMSLLCP